MLFETGGKVCIGPMTHVIKKLNSAHNMGICERYDDIQKSINMANNEDDCDGVMMIMMLIIMMMIMLMM